MLRGTINQGLRVANKQAQGLTAPIAQCVRLVGSSATPPPMRKILIPTRLDAAAKTLLEQNEFKVIQDSDTPLSQLMAKHPDASAMIVRSEKITEELLEGMDSLKLIVRAGAGYNTIDTKAARRSNVDVMNTPGANANAVAEEVIAMIMANFRHIIPADISTRSGLWEKKKFMGRELTGKTVGILGLGHIGQTIVKRLKGFECKILGYDPMVSQSKAEGLGVTLTDVETIFATCDIISLHIPENDDTRKMVNETLLSSMKDKALLLNAARAGIIDEDALRKVKAGGKNIFFATDVYPKDVAGDKPIADVADIMLPHLGANTEEANYTAACRAASQVSGYFSQGIQEHVVNRAVPIGLDPDFQRLAYYLSQVALAVLKGNAEHASAQPLLLDCTFYAGLEQYDRYLFPSLVMGLAADFDPSCGFDESITYLNQRGITHAVRTPEKAKTDKYGNSITVDLVSGKDSTFNKVSIRGTIADGKFMVTRVNDFDGLYFDPLGHNLVVEYKDTVGVLAAITQVLARYNVNVIDVRAPFNMTSGRSLCMVRLDQKIASETVQDIKILTRADRCAYFFMK